LIAACRLATGAAGECRWCGAALPARRKTWCSERCSDGFWNNHWWTLARRVAKKRDKYRCTRCGHKPLGRSDPRYRKRRATDRLEVNHIVAAGGAHRVLSCLHHLDNLETLCLECHRERTAAQRLV